MMLVEKSFFFNGDMQALFEQDLAERMRTQPKPIATTPAERSSIVRYVLARFLG